ncbi:hypothetical protein AVEN_121779-1 [Araneus ventricosus]|uniref:Uncharacterized protein n=1 Tax=Araneus ventricosus TaxID=182803 RepID=A0A4Y2I8L9_ARAVE|nr:hypothetical protein AVEN_121779-1 [Araneus ventricosus]
MSRFEAIGILFGDGPRHFERWSDDEDDTWATPTRGRLTHDRFKVHQPVYTTDIPWNQVSNLRSSGPGRNSAMRPPRPTFIKVFSRSINPLQVYPELSSRIES